MKIHQIYTNLLNEAQIEACVKKFGNELFGTELGGKEKNTGIENKYADEIKDFTDNKYGEEITPEFIKALQNLKGCMKQYPEVLIPEKTSVYRGITIPVKYFIEKNQPIDFKGTMPYVYKARNPIQSWSTEFEAASLFGNHDTVNEVARNIDFSEYQTPESRKELLQLVINEDLRIPFILEYTTNPKEFIFKSKYFRKLSAMHSENELIRIDNNPINVKIKFNEHVDVYLSPRGLMLLKLINAGIKGV